MARSKRWCWILVLATACGPTQLGEQRRAEELMSQGSPEQAARVLEAQREAHPDDPELRHQLGRAYYRTARQHLEAGRFEQYESYLALALDEWVEELRLDPSRPGPHVMMAIVTLHQGQLDSSISSLQNARRLSPRNPMSYSNLGEAYVYKGDFSKARSYLKRARKSGLIPANVEIIEALAAWKTGDLVEARDLFASAQALDPQVVATWNEAPLTDPIETFEDFTSFCCADIACGPYMENACQNLELDVRRREVRDETIRKEMLLEMERRRKLEEIYKRRRDLEIEVEPPEPVD